MSIIAIGFVNGNTQDNARSDTAVNGLHKAFITIYIDVSIISPTCDSNKKNSLNTNILQGEKRKYDDYADRIDSHRGGKLMPANFSSGGSIESSGKKLVSTPIDQISIEVLEQVHGHPKRN